MIPWRDFIIPSGIWVFRAGIENSFRVFSFPDKEPGTRNSEPETLNLKPASFTEIMSQIQSEDKFFTQSTGYQTIY